MSRHRWFGLPVAALVWGAALVGFASEVAAADCPRERALYLTIDTGWMKQAEEIAGILRARKIRATLFVADEATWRGDRTLGPEWRDFWRQAAADGHKFASHTWRHWYFRGDRPDGTVAYTASGGGQRDVLDQRSLCAELQRPMTAIRDLAGVEPLKLWRAPGGHTTPNTLRYAAQCGFTEHVGWSEAGFLGDELSSEAFPNSVLLQRALSRMKAGDIMVMHWGIRSRRDPFVGVLAPLLDGLRAKGFCFATLDER